MVEKLFDMVEGLGFIDNYDEEVKKVAGVETKLAEMTKVEVEALARMLNKMLYLESNVAVKQLYADNFDLIIDLVRAVKTETKQSFGGARARGNQLTVVDLTPDVFDYIWGSSGATDYTFTASSTGAQDYLGTSANPESVAEEEGYIILGVVELSPTPKVNKIHLTKNGDPYAYNTLKFEVDESAYVAALPEPWIFTPESTFYVQANFFKTGNVEMEPIGLKVLQAKNIMSL